MKKYILYIVLGIVYLAGFIGALSFLNSHSEPLPVHSATAEPTETIDTAAIEVAKNENTETIDTETNDTEPNDTETNDTEMGNTEFEDTEFEDTEFKNPEFDDPEFGNTEFADTEFADTEFADTESEEEYLNLPAVYNKGTYSDLRLNLRDEPSMNAQVTGKCNYGDSLTVLSYIDDTWVMVEYNGQIYYCYGKYLTISN